LISLFASSFSYPARREGCGQGYYVRVGMTRVWISSSLAIDPTGNSRRSMATLVPSIMGGTQHGADVAFGRIYARSDFQPYHDKSAIVRMRERTERGADLLILEVSCAEKGESHHRKKREIGLLYEDEFVVELIGSDVYQKLRCVAAESRR
jgi:hypothetical protein